MVFYLLERPPHNGQDGLDALAIKNDMTPRQTVSELGRGTTFRVFLPQVSEPVPSVAGPAEPGILKPGTETILVVEDEEMVRKLAARILQQCGYTVIEASSGPEAMKLTREREGRIDLMLTDVAMPNMNGRELADRIASLKPGMRVLFMSGPAGEMVSPHKGLEDGTMFVYKPFTPETLSQRIREVLET